MSQKKRKARADGKTVLLAPHSDGFGAYSILSRLARALHEKALHESRCELRVVFLWGRGHDTARDKLNQSGLDWAGLLDTPNRLRIPKDTVAGTVNAPEILEVLKEIDTQWEEDINWDQSSHDSPSGLPSSWEDIDLCVSMGQAWLHRAARQARGSSFPSLEVGDMCVSLVLRGCLEEAGLLNPFAERVLGQVADNELLATEAWLLPFAAPREYEDHFATGRVPVNWLPGVFGPAYGEADMHKDQMGTYLKKMLSGRNIIGIHAGATKVWQGAMDALATRPPGRPGTPALITLDWEKNEVQVLEKGHRPIPYPEGMYSAIPVYRNQVLGITRGGITVLDHIAARRPIAVAEEPYHWLSRRQREAATRAGLCIPISLDAFRQSPELLIRNLFNKQKGCITGVKDEVAGIQRRMLGIRNDAEDWLADYLLASHLK